MKAGEIDVAARERNADPFIWAFDLAGEQSREGRGPAWLDHQLETLEAERHRVEDLIIAYQGDAVGKPLDDRKRQLSRRFGLLPIRNRARHLWQPDASPSVEALLPVITGRRLDPDDSGTR